MIKKIKIAVLIVVGISFFVSTAVFADIEDLTVDTGCSEQPSYTGVLNIGKGSYEAYVRLAKRGERAKVAAYTQSEAQGYGECKTVGNVAATGDRWTKAGVVNVAREQQYILQLSSPALASIPDANRPSIMLVPRGDEAVCEPTDECYVSVAGERAYIRPVGTLLNQDSLHALVVKDPHQDQIQSVRYYTDGRLVYTTPDLRPFENKYIEYGGQPLTRVVVYTSGQQAVIETESPLSYQDSFGNFLFRLTDRYPKTLIFLLWTTVVLLGFLLVLVIMRIIRRRQNDRIRHGFAPERQFSRLEKALYFIQTQQSIKTIRLIAIGGASLAGMAALIVLTSSYFLQIITVDGRSMQKSYFTGDNVLVNKVPKTLSAINGREYVPKRGEVVIVHASFGNAILSGENNTDLTLIKRVIALPGERVVIKNGKLTVYNKEHPKGYSPDEGSSWEKQMTPSKKTENIDIQLGPSEIFVSGDNRPESIDSRFNGALDTKEIIGVVIANL